MSLIKVLVVDHSALIRKIICEIVARQTDMEIVGTAINLTAAREAMPLLKPDILILDTSGEDVSTFNFQQKLLRIEPIAAEKFFESNSIIASAKEGAAADLYPELKQNAARGRMEQYSKEMANKIRSVAKSKGKNAHALPPPAANPPRQIVSSAAKGADGRIIVVGASTGGTDAITELLTRMPTDCPGVMITQHMPAAFTFSFANRLNGMCQIQVKEAEQGEQVLPGHAYIAPGHSHMAMRKAAGHYYVVLNQEEPVNRHRPSVDVLFRSAAAVAGKCAVGVILTGMGRDGASGMLEMKQAGSHNFAEDERTCVVFGMPKEAIASGGVDEIVPIYDMAHKVMAYLNATAHAFRPSP